MTMRNRMLSPASLLRSCREFGLMPSSPALRPFLKKDLPPNKFSLFLTVSRCTAGLGSAIAALVLLAAGAFLWRPIYEYSQPPDVSLAILPVQGTGDLQNFGQGVLHDVTERLEGSPKASRNSF